jgi:hypothetical protein
MMFLAYFALNLNLYATYFLNAVYLRLCGRISLRCDKEVGTDFESIASPWLCAKKFKSLNICTTAVMWAI